MCRRLSGLCLKRSWHKVIGRNHFRKGRTRHRVFDWRKAQKESFDSRDWIFEIKLDGYRSITVFDAAGEPHLWSRHGLPLEQKFPAISKAVSRLKLGSTVLDGEIVAVDENGIPRFQLLQRFQKQPVAPTLYFVFDMLWTNGVLGTLLLDAYRNGHSGSGFSEKGLKDALDRMKPLFTDKSPFEGNSAGSGSSFFPESFLLSLAGPPSLVRRYRWTGNTRVLLERNPPKASPRPRVAPPPLG
jgi:ATP-dependent DNA ligase